MIRQATLTDLDAIYEVESSCFPEAEAATYVSLKQRLMTFPNHFWVMTIDDKIIGFVNGALCKEKDLIDEMYDDPSYHDESGSWQMIFGLDVIETYRNHGYGRALLNHAIGETRKKGYLGLVLTCKDYKIKYYESFGFINEGISCSTHGDVIWYQMRLTF